MQIIYSSHHRLHNTDQVTANGLPYTSAEIPARAEAILQAVLEAKLGPVVQPTDHGLEPIYAVHKADYIHYLQTIYDESNSQSANGEPVLPDTFTPRQFRRRSQHIEGRKGYYAFGSGSPILAGTWTAAYWSAQCAVTGAHLLLQGEEAVYALCRPPGHHASSDLYGGYCYLNNAAIAARYLLSNQSEYQRVAILDMDYHHGNGTQEIFYADPQVFYCSLHAHPDDDYPYYWGTADESGEGAGEGTNLNIPLPQGISDNEYVQALEQALHQLCQYDPGAIIISLGLDIAAGDPEGGFQITHSGFHTIGQHLAAMQRPTLLVQEGGYDLQRIGRNILAILKAWS